MPEAEPESIPEEEASDLGSPGFNSSHPGPSEMMPHEADEHAFPEVSEDLYQPGTGALPYPQAVPDHMAEGLDYAAYSNQLGQQQAAQTAMVYPQQSQQTSNTSYPDPLSAPPAPASEPAQPVQTPVQPNGPKSSRSGARRTLPSGTSQTHNGYSNHAATGNGSTWQAANAPASTSQTYTSSLSPGPRAGGPTAAPLPAHVYEASQHEALAAAVTLSQAAMQKTQPSPTTRTVSPFQTPTQAAAQTARANSRQGQRAQRRATASSLQQSTSTQPAPAAGAAAIYNPSTSTGSDDLSNYDQYSRYNTATTQSDQANSRGAYEAFPQQTNSNDLSAPYSGYDGYRARSHSSTATPLAAPVTQGVSASYTKTADSGTSSWSDSPEQRNTNTNSFGANNAAASAKSTYNVTATSTQQQPANMQPFNVRPQSSAHASRTSTPTSYSNQQQHAQQPRQQQHQRYNSYSAQSHSPSGQQPNHHQQQQDWYGFGSSNNATTGYGSSSRGTDYGQSSQQQHRPAAMNISGNTYQSMGDQDLYEIFRGPPAH